MPSDAVIQSERLTRRVTRARPTSAQQRITLGSIFYISTVTVGLAAQLGGVGAASAHLLFKPDVAKNLILCVLRGIRLLTVEFRSTLLTFPIISAYVHVQMEAVKVYLTGCAPTLDA